MTASHTSSHTSINEQTVNGPVPAALPAPLPDSRPTLLDVAREAGVSAATASRVLNGFARVRPETRRQVETAMAALGYVRQRAVRANRPPRTASVAIIVCEEGRRLFSDPFFARIVWAANRELAAAGIQQVLLMVQSPPDYQTSAVRYLRNGHVDGAVFVSTHGRHRLRLDQVAVPVVFAGRPLMDVEPDRACYVDADNRGGAADAVRYLLTGGRSVIATIAGPPDMAPGVDRLAGYRDALDAAGVFDPGLVAYGDFGQASGEHAAYQLLDRRPGVDAIFAASDLMALGVLRALRRTGRRVPEDVAVIGFDDALIARHTEPPLTTVRQPIDEMGARTASELLTLIGGETGGPSHVILDTELVVRESA